MRKSYSSFYLSCAFLFISVTAFAQTPNFEETWKEFLTNNKISNMSELTRPNKSFEQANYAKYLLMNTNSNFCQSEVSKAEKLMTEIQEMDSDVLKSIPEYLRKMDDLDAKIKAYHSMDEVWIRFLDTREVNLDDLDAIKAAKTSCEKKTLAKYSFMTAYYHLCDGDIAKSKEIFEKRTLRLTEKTTLRVRDVRGLAKEVGRMKSLYKDMAKLDRAWNAYMETGNSPGFNYSLPVIPCNPIPNMKALILNGVLDLCKAGPENLERIKELEAQSGVDLGWELEDKIKDLEEAIGQDGSKVAVLNKAWEAFIPDNKVKHIGSYGYDYCEVEPLIRAYIMDGFAFVCENAEEMLQKIDSIQRVEMASLENITMIKINELAELNEQYQANGRVIEGIWNRFVAQGDQLTEDYQSTEDYCDNIHQAKDWVIKGLSGTCEEGSQYLDLIEEFQRTFEFKFFKELECRVQNLRSKVWECRHEALVKLAKIEASEEDYEGRLAELLEEYGMGERPEVCSLPR